MITWVIVIGIVILIALLFLKFDHQINRVKIIALIIIAFLIFLSVTKVFSSGENDLGSPRGVVNAVYGYFGWMGRTVANLWDVGKETAGAVGDAVNLNSSEKDDGPPR